MSVTDLLLSIVALRRIVIVSSDCPRWYAMRDHFVVHTGRRGENRTPGGFRPPIAVARDGHPLSTNNMK
jgi:hypothetical protein